MPTKEKLERENPMSIKSKSSLKESRSVKGNPVGIDVDQVLRANAAAAVADDDDDDDDDYDDDDDDDDAGDAVLREERSRMTLLAVNLSIEVRQHCCSFLSVTFFVDMVIGLVYVSMGVFVHHSVISFGSFIYERYASLYPDFMVAVGVLMIGVHLFGTKV